MQRISGLFLFFLIPVCFHLPSNLKAQSILPLASTTSQEVKADSTEKPLTALPLNEINTASTDAFTLFSRAGKKKLSKETMDLIISHVDSLVSKNILFLKDTAGIEFSELNYRELEALENNVFLLLNTLTKVQNEINGPLKDIQTDIELLKKSRMQWVLTMEASNKVNTPEAIRKRINGVIRQNDSVNFLLQADLDFLLVQSDKITSQQISLDQFNNKLEELTKLNSELLLRRDMPAIWASVSKRDSTRNIKPLSNFTANFKDDTSLIVTKYSGRLILFSCLFIVLLVMVFWIRASMKTMDIRGKTLIMSLYLNEIFQKPIEVSLLLGLYIIRLLIPEIPEAYGSLLAMISVYAVLRIAFDILQADYKVYLLEFAGAYLLLKFYNLFYDQTFLSRIVLLVTQVVALLFLFRFLIRRPISKIKKAFLLNYSLIVFGGVYLILIFLATVGNIVGILSLSEFITTGVIQSTFLVLSTYVGFHVTTAVLYLLLSSGIFKGSNIVKQQINFIYKKVSGILRLVFILSWVIITLSFFNFKQIVFSWGSEFFSKQLHIGEAEFSLLNIVMFVFVIWLSIYISRIVRSILQEEVFTRVNVERGIPSTVIMLVRIVLISIGFMVAAAAAGMQLSSLTIILGAFSVGIGFGLQNIFNNLVSGLILAFERPIKEGDTVEVNSLLGVVKKIGIRSSIVRTYDGAEVVVPNGTLISNELINWTLSDPHRRLDIRVGVAYGTDPEKVLAILLDVAKKNSQVIKDPAPMAYFIGFGDSSLDFRLLAWAELELRNEVQSALNLAINQEIKNAGIEIPFPQRDLHLRSVDGKVIKNLPKK